MNEFSRLQSDWLDKHLLGTFRASPNMLTSPPTEYMSRQTFDGHVQSLKTSFKTSGTVNEDVYAVIINSHLYDSWKRERNPITPTLEKFLNGQEEINLSKPVCIAGAHTRMAMEELSKDFPNAKKWKTMTFKAFICRGTEEDKRLLRILGNSNNVKNKVNLKQSFAQIVEGMHNQGLDVLENAAGGDPGHEAMRQFKEDTERSLDIPPGSVGQLWQLAKRTGKVWKLLKKLFDRLHSEANLN